MPSDGLTQSLTHPLTHSFTHSFTHQLTHPLTLSPTLSVGWVYIGRYGPRSLHWSLSSSRPCSAIPRWRCSVFFVLMYVTHLIRLHCILIAKRPPTVRQGQTKRSEER